MLKDTDLPMVAIMDTDAHLRRRRNWTRGMGPAAIKGYEEFISRRARQLVQRLADQKGAPVLMGEWFNFFSCVCSFRVGFYMLTKPYADTISCVIWRSAAALSYSPTERIRRRRGRSSTTPWRKSLFLSAHDSRAHLRARIATFFGQLPWLGIYVGKIPGATGNLKILLDHCISFTNARVKRGSEKKDLFHYLVRRLSSACFQLLTRMQNNEDLPDKDAPPVQQLVDDGVLAIIAGADTTANALTMLIYCLLKHPEVYEKLQEEVDKYYPPGEDAMNTKHHRDMSYLTACM